MTAIATLVHWVYQYATGGPKACRPAIATQIDPPTGRYRKPGRWARWRAWLTARFTPVKED